MSQLRVKPLPDGVSMRRNWEVTKNGARKSTHTKKSAAKSEARRLASGNDTIVVHSVDGQIQRSFTPSGGSSKSQSSKSKSGSSSGLGVDFHDSIEDSLDDLDDLMG